MKIDGHKTDGVERPAEEGPRGKKPANGEEKDAFKRLLDGEKRGAQERGRETSQNPASKAAKRTPRTGAQERSTRAKTLEGQPDQLGKAAGDFGERLKGGKLQLSQQAERSERHGTELSTERHQHQTRLEQRHRKHHHRQVAAEHSQKSEGRVGGEVSTSSRQQASNHGGNTTRSAARRISDAGERLTSAPHAGELTSDRSVGAAEAKTANTTDRAGATERAERRAEVAELARKLVEKAHVGEDAAGRQILLLDLELPGRGNVRVRLRRRGEGFELRMRPQNDALARDLRHEREHFRQTAAERGVDFTSIEIV